MDCGGPAVAGANPRRGVVTNSAASDRALAALLVGGATIFVVVAGAGFLKDSFSMASPQRRRPWDV